MNLSENKRQIISRFVRFQIISIHYYGTKSIEKCWIVCQNLLRLCKANTSTACSTMNFSATIDEKNTIYFRNNYTLLDHIGNKLLPKFDGWEKFKFCIMFESDKNSAINFFMSFLQFEQIKRCYNIHLDIFNGDVQVQFPAKVLTTWLSQNFDGKTKKAKFIRIWWANIQNPVEIVDHFKEVCTFIFYFTFNIILIPNNFQPIFNLICNFCKSFSF